MFANMNQGFSFTNGSESTHTYLSGSVPTDIMLLILDGNSEHVAHAVLPWKLFQICDCCRPQTNASNRSNYQFHSWRAHLFLSYHRILMSWVDIENLIRFERKTLEVKSMNIIIIFFIYSPDIIEVIRCNTIIIYINISRNVFMVVFKYRKIRLRSIEK